MLNIHEMGLNELQTRVPLCGLGHGIESILEYKTHTHLSSRVSTEHHGQAIVDVRSPGRRTTATDADADPTRTADLTSADVPVHRLDRASSSKHDSIVDAWLARVSTTIRSSSPLFGRRADVRSSVSVSSSAATARSTVDSQSVPCYPPWSCPASVCCHAS